MIPILLPKVSRDFREGGLIYGSSIGGQSSNSTSFYGSGSDREPQRL
jgi:hypothetical protein